MDEGIQKIKEMKKEMKSVMQKKFKILVTMIMLLSLLSVNMFATNSIVAQENMVDISETEKSEDIDGAENILKNETEEVITNETTIENETKEEVTTEGNTIENETKEEMTTKGNTLESETKEEVTTKQEADGNNVLGKYGVEVISDNLPDYVEIVIEKEDIEPFQKALDEYYQQWINDIEEDTDEEDSSDEDWNDEDDLDSEDDDDLDDEDDLADEGNWNEENSDDEDDINDNEEDLDNPYRYYCGSDKVLSAYKISLINTKDGTEYQMPEGQSLEVKVKNEAYRNEAAGGVMSMDADDSIEMLKCKHVYDNIDVEEENNDTYSEDDTELEDDENIDNEDIGDDTDIEGEEEEDWDDDDDAEDSSEYVESISFHINGSGKYAILQAISLAKATSIQDEKAISPKTGFNNNWFAGEIIAGVLLAFSAFNYKKKKYIKINKNN